MVGTLKNRSRLASVALAAGAGLAAVLALAQWPWLVERSYASIVAPAIATSLTRVTGKVPVSLSEPLAATVILWWAFDPIREVIRIRLGSAKPASVLVRQVIRSVAITLVLVLSFYVVWGLAYARPGLVERQGWTSLVGAGGGAAEAQELERLAAQSIAAANAAYEECTGSDDLGWPSAPRMALDALDASLERGFAASADVLGLPKTYAASRGPAKPALSSPLLTRLGIVGYYFPWTAEATYNVEIPAWQMPHAMAHEKAHQRGVASEDEANFLGYVAGAASDEPYVRYSSYMFAQRQLLGELERFDSPAAGRLLKQRLPGVQRDVNYARAFWARYEGRGRQVQNEINDKYLRLHGVEGGVESYARSVLLLVAFARASGGSMLVE